MKNKSKKQADNSGRDQANKRDRKAVRELHTPHRTASRSQAVTGQGKTQGSRTKGKSE